MYSSTKCTVKVGNALLNYQPRLYLLTLQVQMVLAWQAWFIYMVQMEWLLIKAEFVALTR